MSAGSLRGAAVVWVLLIVGRYVDVTTRALYGRDVNPYWDLRHVPSVGAMFATVAEPWQMALFVGDGGRDAASPSMSPHAGASAGLAVTR